MFDCAKLAHPYCAIEHTIAFSEVIAIVKTLIYNSKYFSHY